jgi:hypothetical protein
MTPTQVADAMRAVLQAECETACAAMAARQLPAARARAEIAERAIQRFNAARARRRISDFQRQHGVAAEPWLRGHTHADHS